MEEGNREVSEEEFGERGFFDWTFPTWTGIWILAAIGNTSLCRIVK